jgi:hypothetical protein
VNASEDSRWHSPTASVSQVFFVTSVAPEFFPFRFPVFPFSILLFISDRLSVEAAMLAERRHHADEDARVAARQ